MPAAFRYYQKLLNPKQLWAAKIARHSPLVIFSRLQSFRLQHSLSAYNLLFAYNLSASKSPLRKAIFRGLSCPLNPAAIRRIRRRSEGLSGGFLA
jgi:hypothetical protein